jgi:ribokinase
MYNQLRFHMERLVAVVGQLIVEIQCEELSAQGGRHLIANTRIVPGGRSYRQALYAKKQGYNTILLGRIGEDHYGKVILDSLNALGISTQFVEVSKTEYTGISFEIKQKPGAAQNVFFDPGASTGRGDFHYLLQDYLTLCDVVLLNQWLHPAMSARVLDMAVKSSVPTMYVCSAPPRDTPLEVDYLFLESPSGSPEHTGLQVRKGCFLWSGGELSAFSPAGQLVYKLPLDRDWDGDYVAIRLMRSLSGTARLEETATFAR